MSLPPPTIPPTSRSLLPLTDRDMMELRLCVSYALAHSRKFWPRIKPDRHRLELDDWDELSNHILRHLLRCGYRACRTETAPHHAAGQTTTDGLATLSK